MAIFLEILWLQLRVNFQYRKSFFLAVFISPVMLFLYIGVLKTIYGSDPGKLILGYTLPQMIWYFAGIRFFYTLIWSYPDKELSQQILTGDMTMRLLKPVSVLKWEFAKTLAVKICCFIFEFIPSLLLYIILVFPSFMTAESFGKYLVLVLTAFVLFFLISFLLGITAFLFQNTEAMQHIKFVVINILAGASMPIEFFPQVFQDIILTLPFKYLYYVPTQFLLNKPETNTWLAFLEAWILQLLWIVIFYGLVRIAGFFMIRRYNSVGG
jgi:ABC-2 type transport system permease protein